MSARDLAPSRPARPPAGAAPASGAAAAAGAADSPALAGRYRSLFVLGRGGMGTVEAALELHRGSADEVDRPSHGYDRVVALKRLLPGARDARRVEMFLREARLASILDHANVVRAYDYGEIDGELYLAMEYVEGQALSRVLRALADAKAELGVSLTAHVLAEVCAGLHAAHELRDEKGQSLALVHRDVSPQNVMLGYDGHVRLLDFGVAKIEAESVTKTGEVKGKTAYMSPEQAMGDPIDRRSDLFGVGAVLFECLALRRMWGEGTDMDVIRKLALEKPPRLEDVVPAAPAEIYALYTRLVAIAAGDRPATAKEVAEELRALVPQGREEATKALRLLLERHFGEQAEEQRRLLSSSLEEIAPDQARELRESVSPEFLPPHTLARERESTANAADATGANPVGDSNRLSLGVAAASPRSRTWMWLVLAVVAAAAVVWRVSGAPAATSESATATATPAETDIPAGTVTATTAAPPSPAATAAAAESATGSAAATAPPGPTASTTVTATATATQAPSPPPTLRHVPRPPPSTVAPAPTLSAKPSPTNAPPPAVTARPSPDVDDHPF